MCTAIYAAAVLAALTGGLTFLRIREGRSPNAELLADLLAGQPGLAGKADRPVRSGPAACRNGAADAPC